MKRNRSWALLVVLVCSACGVASADGTTESAGVATPPDTVLAGDVLLEMPQMIRRFQAPHPRVETLRGGAAPSRDALVDAFISAVEDSSAVRLRSLRLDVAEFAWLYFPQSRYTQKPYELPPETLWLLIDQNGLKGEARLLRYFGGTSLGVEGYVCEDEPRREGPNAYWEACSVTIRGPEGSKQMRLFGSIMERDGRFKFVSMTNDL